MSKETKNILKGILFISPWLLGFIIFGVYPIISSFYYSFTDFSITTQPKWIGLDNFKRMFKDEIFWQSLKNTFVYVLGLVPLGLFVAIGIALLLNVKKIKRRGFF